MNALYRFAGAGMTGRLVSMGAQIQNLARDVLGDDGAAEAPLVDAIADGGSYAALAAGGTCRCAGGAQARSAGAARHHCCAGESVRVVGLVGDRGENHALACRFGRRRESPRYFPRWLSPSWSAELTEQAIARIFRPGQTRHVTVHVCVAAGTVDEMKRDRVLNKMSAQEAFRRHLEQI
jgi:hypothetical protein